MDPDRVGTLESLSQLLEGDVSNLYGSRQSRDKQTLSLKKSDGGLFPIYMDPDRVGTLSF